MTNYIVFNKSFNLWHVFVASCLKITYIVLPAVLLNWYQNNLDLHNSIDSDIYRLIARHATLNNQTNKKFRKISGQIGQLLYLAYPLKLSLWNRQISVFKHFCIWR
jgi:hypothetical protein